MVSCAAFQSLKAAPRIPFSKSKPPCDTNTDSADLDPPYLHCPFGELLGSVIHLLELELIERRQIVC